MITCSGCGRGYPADRFAEGRSLHCACGARVGRVAATGVASRPGPPRFLADSMLGGLARWLRAAGFDAAWEPEIEDAALVRRGVAEGRWILTRDRRLADGWCFDNLVRLEEDAPLAQLSELRRRLGLRPHHPFSRCLRCNHPLRPTPEARRAELPPDLRAGARPVSECPACAGLFWEGSHTRRMRRSLEEALDAGAA